MKEINKKLICEAFQAGQVYQSRFDNNLSIEGYTLKDFIDSLTPQVGIWNVLKYLRDDRKTRYGSPKHIHLIEKNKQLFEIELVGNIYDKHLNDKQPTCSDEDPEWDTEWEKYEEYSINYFIGKKIQIDSFEPLKINKIIQ